MSLCHLHSIQEASTLNIAFHRTLPVVPPSEMTETHFQYRQDIGIRILNSDSVFLANQKLFQMLVPSQRAAPYFQSLYE